MFTQRLLTVKTDIFIRMFERECPHLSILKRRLHTLCGTLHYINSRDNLRILQPCFQSVAILCHLKKPEKPFCAMSADFSRWLGYNFA